MPRFILLSVLLFFALFANAQEIESKQDSINEKSLSPYQLKQLEKQKQRLESFYSLNKDSCEIVDLSNLNLDLMPDLNDFLLLKDLDLAGNNLSIYSAKEIGNPNLELLNLSENPLQKVKFKRNDSIRELKLNDCGLTKIPRSIKKLKNLKRVELNHNQIKKIPGFIAKLDSLEEFNLNFNGIEVSKADLKKLKQVEIIQFIGNDLYDLPENISILTSARKLNFSQNNLNTLPSSLAELDSLESLIFYKNQFDSIPSVIFDLYSLNELDFYYNNISEVPSDIDRLTKLKLLFLSYNDLRSIPESLKNITSLQKLYVHHNELIGLPPWIADFKELEVLDVGFNKLAVLPDFTSAIHLKEVDLQENNLSEIPWSILKLPQLERLYIRDNPFEVTEEEALEFKVLVEGLMEKGTRVIF